MRYNQTERDREESLKCEIDSDCVPDDCCHATSCVNQNYAPDCSAVFCTTECLSNTLDCEQGNCKCIDNKCEAVLK